MSEFKSSDRIRRAKHEKNYTIILNSTIQDSRLSWKARGLHHYILSLPDDWHICVAHLAEQSEPDGEAIIKSALKELEVNGYITKTRLKDDRGRFLKCVWNIYESPQVDFQPVAKVTKRKTSKQSPQVDFPQVDKPQVDKPQVDKPQVENRGLIINDQTSTNLLSTDQASKEKENTRSENIYTAPPENFPDSDLPANQVLIDCMAEHKENPIPPTPLSFLPPENIGLAIAENTKPQKAKKQQCDLNLFLQVWNQDAPRHWVRHTTIDSATARKLIKFANEFENSLEMFQKGLWFAQTDTQWCMKPTTKLKMTNVLSCDTNLIFQFYESYEDNQRRSQQSPLDRPMTPVENKMAHTYSMILEAIA